MPDQISNIIDVTGFNTDLKTVVDGISSLESKMDEANAKAIRIEIDAKNIDTLNELIALTQQQAQNTRVLGEAQQQNITITKQLETAQQQYGQSFQQSAVNIVEAKLELQRVNEQIRHYEELVKTATGATEANRAALGRYYQQQVQLRQEISSFNKEMKEVNVQMNQTTNHFNLLGLSAEGLQRKVAYMALSFVGWGLILGPLMGKLEEMWKAVTKLSDGMAAAADNAKKFQDNMKSISTNKAEGLGNILADTNFDQAKAQSALAAVKDATRSVQERVNAYKDLQSIAQGVLPRLTPEQEKSGAFSLDEGKVTAAIDALSRLKQATTDLRTSEDALGKMRATYQKMGLNFDNSQTRLFNQNTEQKAMSALTKAQEDYNKAYNDLLKLRVVDEKVKKPNAKDLNAELELEKARHEKVLLRIQAEYDRQDNTNEEAKIAHDNERLKKKAEEDLTHYENQFFILKDFDGKTGESHDKYAARYLEIQNQLTKSDNLTLEQRKKLSEELKKIWEDDDKAIQDFKDKYTKAQQEILAVDREIDAVRQKAKIDNKYAAGAGPILEGMGFGGADHTGLQQRSIDIAKIKENIGVAQGNLSAESDKDAPDSLKQLAIQKTIEDEKLKLAKLEAEQEAELDQKTLSAKKELGQQLVNLYEETFTAINTIRNNGYERERQQLAIQQQEYQTYSSYKIEAIQASTNYAITKDNLLQAQYAADQARQNEFQQRSNQIELRKAQADKQAAEGKVISDTAVGIMKVWSEYGDVPVLAAALSAVIGGIGAEQYAAVQSVPLPQFEGGGKTSTPLFIAGEAGPELGITPSGDVMMFDKPGVYASEIGTNIKTADETQRLINYAAANMGMGYNASILAAAAGSNWSDEKIVERLDDLIDVNIQGALIRNRPGKPEVITGVAKRVYYSNLIKNGVRF